MTQVRLEPLLRARQSRFLAAGVLAVVTDYSTFFVTYGMFHLGLGAATVAAYSTSLAVSFCVNKLWVFDSRGQSITRDVRQFLLYGLLLAFNIAFTFYFMLGLKDLWHVDPRLSKPMAIGVTTAWNYLLYSRVIFPERRAA